MSAARIARLVACLAGLALSLGLPPTAEAVIIAAGDGKGNTEAPLDDFGFANVGGLGLTAVYLGNGWMITAGHVALSDVQLGGALYSVVPGSRTLLTNADSERVPDLAVFRLQDPTPPLPSLRIAKEHPVLGQPLVLVGRGYDRGLPTSRGDVEGWKWGENRTMRWGTNRVSALGLRVTLSSTDLTHAFATEFDPEEQTEYESQAATGDSGGAVFLSRDGHWELAGVMFAASTFGEQVSSTALYGNVTYVADLSVYRDQILALIADPSCNDGFDGDGDGLIDYPEDPECSEITDSSEAPPIMVTQATGMPGPEAAENRDEKSSDSVWRWSLLLGSSVAVAAALLWVTRRRAPQA